MKIIPYISALAVSIFIAACSTNDRAKNSEDIPVDSSSRPDSEVRGARIYLYDEGRITTEIDADVIHKFEANDSTMGYHLDIVLYDSTGGVNSTIVGDSGVIREQAGHLDIYGNVVVVSDDGSRLTTDYLFWDQDTQRLRTDSFVKIVDSDGNVLTGWGLEAEQNPTRYRILNQVSGSAREQPE
jgi:LPS export ABC transporter protein LptC